MKYTARTWHRLAPNLSRGVITFITLLLLACENNSPSQIESPSTSAAALDYDLYGSQIGGEGKSYLPADPSLFSVNAGSLGYSDQQLLTSLNGQLKRSSSFSSYTVYWAQTSGPAALILNPNNEITEAILPQVDEPTWVSFNLLAIADDLYYAQDTVRIRVLPSPQSLLAVTTSVEEFLNQVTINVRLNQASEAPVNFSYNTEDGSAIADADYVAQSGQFILDSTQNTTSISISLLNDTTAENNEYFSLNFSSDFGGQQKTFIAIVDDENPRNNASKPQSLGPITEAIDSFPGTHGYLRALLFSQSDLTSLVVTDPCQQQYPANSEYPPCNGRNPFYEAGTNEQQNHENLVWDAPWAGTYVFSVTNRGQEPAVIELLVFNGDSSERLVASIPAGTTLEITQVTVAPATSESSVTSSSAPSSSSSAAPSSSISVSSSSSVMVSSSATPISSSLNTSSSAPALDLAQLCLQQRLDCAQFQTEENPYEGTQLYRDPDYQTKIQTYASQTTDKDWIQALARIENTATAIWLDMNSMVLEGDQATARRSLKEQLEAASAEQAASAELMPMAVQVVVRTSPIEIQDKFTEQNYTAEQLSSYNTDVIDPLLKLAQEFPNLRLILVLEPNLVPSLIKAYSQNRPDVNDAKTLVSETLGKLADVSSNNIYTYLGIGHGSWILREVGNIATLARELLPIESTKFRGFASNVGSYSPTLEPLFIYNREVLQGFYQDQIHVDELDYLNNVQNALIIGEIDREFNYIIDTSRNGWGGVERPTLAGGMASRIDQRHYRNNWCNIKQAGIGEFPKVSPISDYPIIDAFTWIKQPGYSDGASATEGVDEAAVDACDVRNEDSRAKAPAGGVWFGDHFTQLVENAWPPLLPTSTALGMPFDRLDFSTVFSDSDSPKTENVVLRGLIAADIEIQSLEFYINGEASPELAKQAKLYGSQFDLSISPDLFTQTLIRFNSSQTVYDDTKFELTVVATDNLDVRYEQTVFYTQARNASGTDAADLIFFESGNYGFIYGYAGNDLFLPKDNQNFYASIAAGAGDDVVYITSGRANGDEGNDRIFLELNNNPDSVQANGDLGDDNYYYTVGDGDSLWLTEVVDPKGGNDTLHLQNATVDDINEVVISLRGNAFEDLNITFKNGGNIRILSYMSADKTSGNTVETIRFSDQTQWKFEDVLRLAFPEGN